MVHLLCYTLRYLLPGCGGERRSKTTRRMGSPPWLRTRGLRHPFPSRHRQWVLREEWTVHFVKYGSYRGVGKIRQERKVNIIWWGKA